MNAPVVPHYADSTQPNLKTHWFVGNEYLNYPNLFTHGYKHFLNTIDVHNKRWPNDPWPTIPISEFLTKARNITKNKYTKTHPPPMTAEQRKHKLNQEFYHYIIDKYGAWPNTTNPYYQSIAHAQGYYEYPDIKKEKEQFLMNKMLKIANRIKK